MRRAGSEGAHALSSDTVKYGGDISIGEGMDLNGKRILITGGATGIGRSTATRCAAEGARVVVADINPAEGEQRVEGIRSAGGEAWYVKVDVSTESDVAAMAADADRLMGGIDAMVSAAGIAQDSLVPIDELPTENWERTIAVNLRGSYLTAKHLVPAIRKAGGGVIVMIASGCGCFRGIQHGGIWLFQGWCKWPGNDPRPSPGA